MLSRYSQMSKSVQHAGTARHSTTGDVFAMRAVPVTSHWRVNRTHSRAVTGLLTGHNNLRRHLHLLGLLDSPLCRRCEVREETWAHILCECKALASLRHAYLGSFFLEPKDIQSISLGAIWSFSKASGLPWSDMGHKGPVFGLGASGPWGPKPKYNQSINTWIHFTLQFWSPCNWGCLFIYPTHFDTQAQWEYYSSNSILIFYNA
jgi:hypothetical protein